MSSIDGRRYRAPRMSNNGLDESLSLLSHRHRRRVIRHLRREPSGTATIDSLVNLLADEGRDTDLCQNGDRRGLAVQLRHNHLPQLQEFEVVELDHERGLVTYCPNQRIEDILDAISGELKA